MILRSVLYFVINLVMFNLANKVWPAIKLGNYLDFGGFLILLTILNWSVVPILNFLTFPINFLTLGLVSLIINLIAINFAANLSRGLIIDTKNTSYILTLIVIAITLSLSNAIINLVI